MAAEKLSEKSTLSTLFLLSMVDMYVTKYANKIIFANTKNIIIARILFLIFSILLLGAHVLVFYY
jgi:hypothetical protein